MANHDMVDHQRQDLYYMGLKEDFVRGLVNQGHPEDQVRNFLKEKGAYQHDINLMAHSLRLGAKYERVLQFNREGCIDPYIEGDSHMHEYNLITGTNAIQSSASAVNLTPGNAISTRQSDLLP